MKNHHWQCDGRFGGECTCDAPEELCPACQPCPICGNDNGGLLTVPYAEDATRFISFLIDNCEGMTVTEEFLQQAYSDYLKTSVHC